MWAEVGSNTVIIVGAPGSPYSRKMLALLRYRRIPYRWITRGSKEDSGLPAAKVDLLPLLLFDNGNGELEAAIDSTPLIRRLEAEHAASPLADRSVLPPDPALAMLDALVEDFASPLPVVVMNAPLPPQDSGDFQNPRDQPSRLHRAAGRRAGARVRYCSPPEQ